MPTYEYACSSCKHEWEAEQSIKDDALTECPSCHAATAKRQISRGTGFILKGSGWYADLYSSSSNAKPAETKSDEGSKPSGSTGSGTGTGGSSEGSGGSSSSGSASGSSGSTPAPSGSSAKSESPAP